MSYQEWLNEHIKKHKKIVEKLLSQGLNKEEIIKYFDFENMKKNEKSFCPLYEKDKKCHDIKNLNCYFCGCPYFVFDDNGIKNINGKTLFSLCSIKAKNSKQFFTNKSIHQDCSECFIPHKTGFIKKNFKFNLNEVL